MSLLVLIGFAFLCLGLAGVAAVANPSAGRRTTELARTAAFSGVALAMLGIVLVLVRGGTPSSLPIPLGTPAGSTDLSLDAVGLAFGLPMMLALAALVAVVPASLLWRVVSLAAASLLLVVAGDEVLLLLAVTVAALAAWGAAVESALAALLAIGAAAPLLPGGGLGGDAFSVLRGVAAAHGSGMLGGGASLGLSALFLGRAPHRLPGADAALASVGALLLARFGFDLGGASYAAPLGSAAAIVGLALGLVHARRAVLAPSIPDTVDGLASSGKGLALAALGIALLARSSDLPETNAAAIGSSLLFLVMLAIAVPLAHGTAARIGAEAGSLRLDALGGLVTGAPRLSLLLALSLAALAGLPPFAGFAPVWLLAEILLAPARFGGSTLPVAAVIGLGVCGLILGLLLAASFRAGAIVILGRPRTPRAAAAIDPSPARLQVLAAEAALLGVVALLPGPLLRLLSPGLATLAGTGIAPGSAGFLWIAGPGGGAILSPLLLLAVVAAVLLLANGLGRMAWTKTAAADGHPVPDAPVWDGGAEPPPDWLPFGEPRAQPCGPFVSRQVLASLGIEMREGSLPGEGSRPARAATPLRRLHVLVRVARRRLSRAWRPLAPGAPGAAQGLVAWGIPALALAGLAALLGSALAGGLGGLRP